jgi:heterodisulfide reductase subunit A2
MARLVQSRQSDAHVTFFYIDVQTFGKDFHRFYSRIRDKVNMVRAIPGDIIKTDQDELKVLYFDPDSHTASEDLFDVVVLSVGLLPTGDSGDLSRLLNWSLDNTGFICSHDTLSNKAPAGIFSAGSATGPMSIAESVGSAEKTVFDIIRYLEQG